MLCLIHDASWESLPKSVKGGFRCTQPFLPILAQKVHVLAALGSWLSLVAMSYCPSGPPESQHRDIWVSGKVGDSRSRCISTSLHQKGYDASWQHRFKRSRSSIVFRCVNRDLVHVTSRDYHRNRRCNSIYHDLPCDIESIRNS